MSHSSGVGATDVVYGFIDINSFATASSVSAISDAILANTASIQSNQAAIQMAQFSVLELHSVQWK